MLRKILYAIAAVIVLIIIAVVVLPYFVGVQAERGFEYQVASFNASHSVAVLHVDAYHRGFYSSDADVSLQGTVKGENQTFGLLFGTGGAVKFHIRINHGPIPFAAFATDHWNFTPVLYTAEFRGEDLPASSILGSLKPNLYLVQYFNGATLTHIAVPPGRFGVGVAGVTWQGGEVDIHVNGARNKLHYAGAIRPVNFQFGGSTPATNYSGTFKGVRFSATAHKGKYDFWLGQFNGHFAGLIVNSGRVNVVTMAEAQGRAQSSEAEQGRWLNQSGNFLQKGGTIKGWSFSQLTLKVSLARVDAAGLRRGLNALRAQAVHTGGAITGAPALAAMSHDFAPAVATATTARLALSLAAASGSAAVSVRIGFSTPPPAAGTAAAELSLTQEAAGEGSLSFDSKLVDDFARTVLGVAPALVVDQSLKSLAAQGYLTQTPQGGYRALIGYRTGVLTINGRSVNASAPATRTVPGASTASGASSSDP